MIEVNIKDNANETEVVITGHAMYAEKGNDIVCAAVSTIFYTMLNFFEDRKTSEVTKYVINKDMSVYKVANKSRYFAEIFPVFVFGFKVIENDYPGYVKCNIERMS